MVTSSSGHDQDRLHVMAFGAADGKLFWDRQFWATGRTQCHPKMAVATPTPASDGKRIVAFYSSNDLACLDREGNLLWFRGLTYEYPKASNSLGMSSSPVIADDTVIVQVGIGRRFVRDGPRYRNGRARAGNLSGRTRPTWTSPVADSPAGEEATTRPLAIRERLVGNPC